MNGAELQEREHEFFDHFLQLLYKLGTVTKQKIQHSEDLTTTHLGVAVYSGLQCSLHNLTWGLWDPLLGTPSPPTPYLLACGLWDPLHGTHPTPDPSLLFSAPSNLLPRTFWLPAPLAWHTFPADINMRHSERPNLEFLLWLSRNKFQWHP